MNAPTGNELLPPPGVSSSSASSQAATSAPERTQAAQAHAASPVIAPVRRRMREPEGYADTGSSASLRTPRSSSPGSSSRTVDDDDTISIVELLENLVDHRWAFGIVALLCSVAALGYAFLATPVYTVDALVQVEDRKGSALGGALGEVAQALDVASSSVLGETEIMRSRSNVAAAVVALDYHTDVAVANRAPLVGDWLASRLERDASGLARAPALPFVGTADWAWGGERLALAEFTVPLRASGRRHELEIGNGGEWALRNEDGQVVLHGRDRTRAADEGTGYALRIDDVLARPGTRFELRRFSTGERVEQLRAKLRVAETKRQSGIMRVEYPDPDPVAAARIVNAITAAYVQQNVRRRSEEADNSLRFLEQQLPQLRGELDRAEEQLNVFRNENRTIDIPGEIGALLAHSTQLEKERLELELRRKEVASRYEISHPVARALHEQIASVSAQQQRVDEQIQRLPLMQQEYLRLSRDAKVSSQLYVSLLNNAQQLRVARAGTTGNVSVVDPAIVPQRPSSPQRLRVIGVGVLGGLAAGFLFAQLLAAWRGRLRDPRDLEERTGIHVLATLAVAPEQQVADRRNKRKGAPMPFLLARSRPTASAVEALRTLRLNLQLALAETQGGRTILFTSAMPGQGKSFVSANLAYLIATAGPRVLLIDADLRLSSIRRYFAIEGRQGLVDVLRDGLDPAPFVCSDPETGLSVLPAGLSPDNPGELLTTERLGRVFAWAVDRYDVVIIDAPPILPVSDAVVLGGFADVSAFVVRHKRAARSEVVDAVEQYQLAGTPVSGFVFNCYQPSRVRYGYGARYGYYRGQYGYGGTGKRGRRAGEAA